MSIENLTNKKYGEWLVLRKSLKKRKWVCVCSCGQEVEVLDYHLKSGASSRCRICSGRNCNPAIIGEQIRKVKGSNQCLCKCGCGGLTKWMSVSAFRTNRITRCTDCGNLTHFKGYKDISGAYWRLLRESSLERGYVFDIDIVDVWDMFEQQDRKCALSGLTINFSRKVSKDSRTQTASIDRIDNTQGYIKGNIQIVHKKLNFMKHTSTMEEFIELCNLVAQRNPRTIDPLDFSDKTTIDGKSLVKI
jgi:hypothetical protein